MGETIARGDFLVDKGTPLIDSGNDLCPGNVGGQLVAYTFHRLNLTTNMAAVVVPITGGNTTNAEFLMPRAGSLIGIAIQLSAAAGTSTADAWATVNGTTQATLKAHLNAATAAIARQKAVQVVKDSVAVAQFERVGVKVTTGTTLAPAGLDFNATVYLEF